MSRKTSAGTETPRPAEQMSRSVWNGSVATLSESLHAQQELLQWLQDCQLAQARNLQQWSDTMQASLEAASEARDWSGIVAAQNEWLSKVMSQATQAQVEQLQSWFVLQNRLVRSMQQLARAGAAASAGTATAEPEAAGAFDPASLYEQAKAGLDAWQRQWKSMFRSEPAKH